MNVEILRKLGEIENLYLGTISRARTFAQYARITSRLNLFANLGLLNRSMRQWASMHPLLLAKVASIDGHNYFVHDERFLGSELTSWRKDESDLENVKYLKFVPDSADGTSSLFDDIASLLCQREMSVDIDCFNEPLWKVQILEIPRDDGKPSTDYYFTLLLQHCISEGRNLHMLMLQLFDLIEHNLTAGHCPELPVYPQVYPNYEEIYYKHFDPTGSLSNRRVWDLPYVPWPAYLDAQEANRCPPKPFSWETATLAKEWIYRIDATGQQRGFIRLQDLVEGSKQTNARSRIFSLSTSQTAKLVEKCKQMKCSVTLALTNLFTFALRKLELRLCAEKNKAENPDCVVMFAVTMRQLAPTLPGFEVTKEFTDQIAPGVNVSITKIAQKRLKSLKGSELDSVGEFWASSEADTEELRQTIQERAAYFFVVNPREPKPREMFSNIFISNLGVVPAKLPDEYALSPRSCISIQKAYMDAAFHQKDMSPFEPFVVFCSSCNERFHVSFVFVQDLFSSHLADQIVQDVLSRFDQIFP